MRFIPAGAGNTILFATSPAMPTVYPRWRGEHLVMVETNGPGSGLSPLARGTLAFRKKPTSNTRFIPAGAGNTCNSRSLACFATVYPRWRGEHADMETVAGNWAGLSPLARGTRGELYIGMLQETVYPRWRGEHVKYNSPAIKINGLSRWRGEHDEFRGPVFVKIGLSPLARGTRVEGLYIVVFRRFIPAGAGNTLKLYICSKSPFLLHNKLPTVR